MEPPAPPPPPPPPLSGSHPDSHPEPPPSSISSSSREAERGPCPPSSSSSAAASSSSSSSSCWRGALVGAPFLLEHVQLSGGAPWGFTLKGGLEHGEPLIVSKVEDGGKAALSQKMRSGDELVNINGTPLYGSRQEALILIKGSYRTLKMIIRRRNVPVIRPHSWHLAKLSEGRTEAATMPCPPDAFSLSWHSGCDTSDLPSSWTPLSRHCSTDKSSSLGSMESLGPPSHSYCEGSLSPIDQAMYQNKRDSAYSSFSASSNASDSALRPEEGSSTECIQQPDPRYLQTGSEGSDPAAAGSRASSHPPGHHPASYAPAGPFPAAAKAASSPPQPPVRQDSLKACNPLPEGPKDPPNPKGHWASDTSLSVRSREPQGPAGQGKDCVATEQYYLLSSHSDQSPAMEKRAPSAESLLNEEGEQGHPLEDPGQHLERKDSETDSHHITCPSPWKTGWSGPLGHHRHSAPEHLLAAQLQALNVAHIQEGPQWTVSPLHVDQKGLRDPKPWMNQDQKGQGSSYQAEELDRCPGAEEGPQHRPHGLERPRSASVELAPALSLQHQHPPPPSGSRDPQVASGGTSALREGGRDAGGSHPAPRKGVLAQHRSAQMRRRSDRFATNLRNEIQWRKAQLQKAKGAAALLCGEEAVQETEEHPSSPSSVDDPSWSPPPPPRDPSPSPPPPPMAESVPHGSGPSIRRWGSELSVFGKEAAGARSPGRGAFPAPEPRWKAQGPERPPKSPLPPVIRQGGRWRWSPEHKLQPHDGSPRPAEPESPSRLSEESGLLPFADRRRFFEESSKPLSPIHLSPRRGRFGGVPPHRREEEQNAFQPVSSEHREQQQQQRRHSMDQAFGPSPSPPTYQDFHPEAPGYHKPLARHRPDWECWQPLPCPCAPREACPFCYGERCPPLHQRNLSVPSGHCAHRCHPHSWNHCPDCCCPAQHRRLEERGAPWHGRKAFQMEFPVDEWEPPAINRKTSQSMSELPQHKMGFARASPFWTCFEEAEPEWPPSFCRAISARNLSWDGERPGRVAVVPENPDYEEPRKPPMRGRAYSESHLCAELASGATGRDPREAPLAKVEETLLEPPCVGKKKGPPPPRPPPPNWEKYRPRRASHSQLLPTHAGPVLLPEDPRGPGQEATRQRSQSLPLEQLWREAAHLQPLPCASPPCEGTSSSPGAPVEQSSLRYYCHGSPCRTPEWPTPDASERSGSSRPSSSLDEEAMPEPVWEKGPSGPSTHKTTEPSSPANLPSSPIPNPAQEAGAARESRPSDARSPKPPFRLNSEELMRDMAGRDRSLAGVLGPALGRKTAAEVMEDLFSASDCSVWKGKDCSPQTSDAGHFERQPTQPVPPSCGGTLGAPSCSVYYNTSVGKAELPGKVKDLPAVNSEAGEEEEEEEEEEMDRDLAQKKVQLIESISRKLGVLQEAQRGLEDDLNANVALGKEVETHVKRVCKAHEFEKFRLFIGDLDKVVNLLLSLSGRLARVENALGGLAPDAPEEEKLVLLEKKRQLTAQLEDARELQEHVARRERLVFASVSRCLPSEQLQDYQHFVRMKSALAIQQRQLDDKIKLGEEQLRSLRESLRRTGAREY